MEADRQSNGVVGPSTDVPFDKLWKALVEKTTNPGKYLKGVETVTTRTNADGSIYREMALANGATMKENIYVLEEKKRVEFRIVDRPMVVINQYLESEKAIEYSLETPEGESLGWWKGMREGTMEAIKGQYEKASTM